MMRFSAILTELRAACDQHGVDWPEPAEREIRRYLRDTMDR